VFRSRFWCRATLASAALFLTTSAVLATPASAATPPKVVSGSGQGTVFPKFTPLGATLLDGFEYHFTNGDHPLQRVGATPLPQQSAMEVMLADKNGGDNFTFRIAHDHVDQNGIQSHSLHGSCAGQCDVPLGTRPPGDVVFVITGFRFAFDNGEHPIGKIMVFESGGGLSTSFRDQNGDDPYTFDVGYAWVPRSRLDVANARTSGIVHGRSSTTIPAAIGEKVISGFLLESRGSGNAGDDNIRDLGIVAGSGSFDLLFGDRNPADSADWFYLLNFATVA
jgi:hypothetical protein